MTDKHLRRQPELRKKQLTDRKKMNIIRRDAVRAGREGTMRTLTQRHFDVQLIGAMVLHECKVSEMKTGEGKTHTAALALYLNALEGKGAHLVTVNDYLAQRDAGWMGQIYNKLGLSTGVINPDESYIW